MLNNISSNSLNSEINLKNESVRQQSNSINPIHVATRLPFKNLALAFQQIALGILKIPIAIFRSAILAMRCKSGPFLENWSWKAVKGHFDQVKVLLKPSRTLVFPSTKPLEKPFENLPIIHFSPPELVPLKVKDPDIRLEKRVAKAMEAYLKMGSACLEQAEKGVHGAQFVKSIKNKNVGVFKEIPDSIPNWKNPFSQKAYLNSGKEALAAAERASYLLAKELQDPHLTVPPVKILDFDGKKGSFAVYEKGIPADQIIHEVDNKSSYTDKELYIFQIFVILDYLLGNLDRKLENWLILWEDQTIKAIFPIDNSNTFPTQRPSAFNVYAAKNLYQWKELKLANIPFNEGAKDFVNNKIIDETIQKILKIIDEDEQIQSCYPQGEKFLNHASRLDFNLRTLKLRQLFLVNDKLTPKELAEH